MKAIFLTFVVVLTLAGIVYLINPLLLVNAWNRYKTPIGSEMYCAKFDVIDCPHVCIARPNSLIDEKDLGCHAKPKVD